jgi:Domain of unknown function (DUF4062)
MDRFFQVFLSSTFEDLKPERSQVSDAIAKAGYVTAGMELFPASDQQQLEYIKTIIDRSDYYVLILAGRYGSLADNGYSYTENEFDYARSKNIPVLAFLHANPASIPVGKSEADPARREKLDQFKQKLRTGRIIEHWNDANDLCLKVVTAIAHSVNLTKRPGWIRGDQAIDPKVLQDMEKLRIENQELRERLSTLDTSEIRFDPRFAGPDEFIDLAYQASSGAPNSPRIFNITLKLKDIFVASYGSLLNHPNEGQVSHTMGQMLAKKAATYMDGPRFSLTDPSIQKLRTQLEALDLINIIGDPSAGSGMASRRWQVTEKGKRFALLELALTRPDSSAS